jgi:hypothetical protein
MRHALGLALMVLSITSSGCALVQDSCRNVFVGLKTPVEEHREKARNRQWAEAAWQQVVGSCSHGFANHVDYSKDYAHGFKDGFAEYLYRGGDGEPPLVAPLRYRDTRYQNEQGYHAVQDWFAGYRHGAAMARDSGARKWITGPSSLQMGVDGIHVHEEPPQADGPLPEKLTPIPLPQPKVVPKVGEEPVSIAPTKVPLDRPRALPDDGGSPLPPALRQQILKVTEAAREGPAPGPLPEPNGGVEQPSVEPPPVPARPMEPEMAVTAPMKIQLDRPRIQQAPKADPAPPLPEALRMQIQKIAEAAQASPEIVIINGPPGEAKIRIMGIHDAPTPERPRITGIIAIPQKD